MSNYNSYLQYLQHVADATEENFLLKLNELDAQKESEKLEIKTMYSQTLAQKEQELADLSLKIKKIETDHSSRIVELEKKYAIDLKEAKEQCVKKYELEISNIRAEALAQMQKQQDLQNNLDVKLQDKDEKIKELEVKIQTMLSNQQPLIEENKKLKDEISFLEEKLKLLMNNSQKEKFELKKSNEQKLNDWNNKFEQYKSEVMDGTQLLKKEIESLRQQLEVKEKLVNTPKKSLLRIFGK